MEKIVFPFLVGVVFFAFWLTSSILNRLKSEHGEIYAEMGEPALIMNNTPKTMMSFQKFLMLRKFKVLNDTSLDKKCEVLFWLQIAWLPTILIVPFWLR